MTIDQENPQSIPPAAPAPRAGWAKWVVIAGVGLVAVAGIGIAGAISDDFGKDGMRMAWMGGDHHRGPDGPGRMGFDGPGFGRMLEDLDLTNDQEDKIWAIMDGVHRDARPLMREFRGTREELAKLLGAPTIDSAAVETLRADRVAKVDEASKKLTTALVAAAQVLTPEQRTKFLQEMEDHAPRGRW